MSDQQLDFSDDWFLGPAETSLPQLGRDSYQLPPNISDSALWNNLPFDVNVTHDHNPQFDNVPPSHAKPDMHSQKQPLVVSTVTDDIHLNTSPITTRMEGALTSPESLPTPNYPSHRAPSTLIPNNPRRTNKPASPLKKTPTIQKSIAKNQKLPDFQLSPRHINTAHKASKQKSRSKKLTPKRIPKRLAKAEVALLSPLLASKKTPAHKSPSQNRAPDASRERHNQMMRENRHRFNNKFKELKDLLDLFKEAGSEYKPMKNKIQILERTIYQYALMQTKCARYETELLFSPEQPEEVNSGFLKMFLAVPSLSDACNLVLQNMCSSMNWKYGEAWVRTPGHGDMDSPSGQYELCTAFVSKNNMPDTRLSLDEFSKKSKANAVDDYLLTMSQHRHAVWIPNLSAKADKSHRAAAAKKAGITTMVTIPIFFTEDPSELPDAIITLMHVNDELLSFQREERPYDSQSIIKVQELVTAVVKTRAKMAC